MFVLQPAELTGLQSAIEEANPLRSPLFSVGGYYVQELLGSGAFGNVYKVFTVTTSSVCKVCSVFDHIYNCCFYR